MLFLLYSCRIIVPWSDVPIVRQPKKSDLRFPQRPILMQNSIQTENIQLAQV